MKGPVQPFRLPPARGAAAITEPCDPSHPPELDRPALVTSSSAAGWDPSRVCGLAGSPQGLDPGTQVLGLREPNPQGDGGALALGSPAPMRSLRGCEGSHCQCHQTW